MEGAGKTANQKKMKCVQHSALLISQASFACDPSGSSSRYYCGGDMERHGQETPLAADRQGQQVEQEETCSGVFWKLSMAWIPH